MRCKFWNETGGICLILLVMSCLSLPFCTTISAASLCRFHHQHFAIYSRAASSAYRRDGTPVACSSHGSAPGALRWCALPKLAFAKRAASTPTWVARKCTTSGAASCLERKKRPSSCKHLRKTANPRRVAPDLLPTAAHSSGRRGKCGSQRLWGPRALHLLLPCVVFAPLGG
jgi:hypothetical protein